MMVVPSKLSVIRKTADFARARPTLFLSGQRQPRGGGGRIHDLIALTKLLKLQRSGQFPDEPVRIKVRQIHYVTCLEFRGGT
jgi:hypothetical protein